LNRPWSIAVDGPSATTVSWAPRAGAFDYDVCRGNLAALATAAGTIDLGPLACIDAATPIPDTVGFEDSAVPSSGSRFFYLVRPRDGLTPPSYGQGSGGRERLPGAGDCAP